MSKLYFLKSGIKSFKTMLKNYILQRNKDKMIADFTLDTIQSRIQMGVIFKEYTQNRKLTTVDLEFHTQWKKIMF